MMKVPVCQNAEKIAPGDALKTAPPGEVITGTKNKLRSPKTKTTLAGEL